MAKKDMSIVCRVTQQEYLDFIHLKDYVSKKVGVDLNVSDTFRWLIKNFPKEDISDV